MDASVPTVTQTSESKPKAARPRKVKPASTDKGKRSLNLSLAHEDYQRLAIHALHMDVTISDLVAKLAREHLREVHLTRTGSTTRATEEAA